MAAFENDFVYSHPLFTAHCKIWWRYIDNIFCIWDGPIESLLLFDNHINNIWPELKFSIQHDTNWISFLDTLIYKERGVLLPLIYSPNQRTGKVYYTLAVAIPLPLRIQSRSHNFIGLTGLSLMRTSKKRAKNLKDRLVKADVGPGTILSKQSFLQTQRQGTFPCLNCLQCSNVQKGPAVFHPHTGKAIPIRVFYTCESTFVIYLIKCPCDLAYVGETTQAVRDRVSQHKSTIRCKKTHFPLPHHFIEKNHNISQLRFQVLEQIDPLRRGQNCIKMLKRREAYWIFTLQTRQRD
ncbi:unnamed protein product [Ranitomeya imitator]|uniref:GIY-YIG domain-containing protein n=1 Tax=Ranitomeya imitator TaxID=111125 RepID=A0ABN9KTT0_9NEOB|nr:unnamed protein product [Ranitomeya imitator]